MPSNRSHHFVPRCYLRNFARADGKVIRLYNILRQTVFASAPVKSQCARNYFYGNDELEFHLGDIEGRYAEWITQGVLSPERKLIDDIDLFCKFFTLVQYMRTEAHAARMRGTFGLMEALAEIPEDSEFSPRRLDLSDTALARDGIFFALEMRNQISDLKLAFLDNMTETRFVTCDDPVVQTNRLYIQRVGQTNFGIRSAGTIFYVPLSPRVAMLLYDGDVYTLPKSDRYWVGIKRDQDVHAFNELIFLKARENVYFLDQGDFSTDRFQAVADRRIVHWHRGRILVPIGEEEGGRIFAEADEPPPEGNYVIATSQQHPRPKTWPSVLGFRRPAIVYGNGSEIGYVRKHTVPTNVAGVIKIKI
ncbi:MAG TPA: DUF4238 domain-containing protein [Allosphingosinicella sp.]|nr:DUF4238 domain-containing protein [Allosphingosinicella sp.]HYG31229.1 DUF4238 domain-containing protein [Allosphingosinicella sp.]